MIKSNENNHGEVIKSLPVGRQIGMHKDSSEAFFKLDEELSDDFLHKPTHYATGIDDDVDLANIDFDENLDASSKNFTVGSPDVLSNEQDSRAVSIEKSGRKVEFAASIPIDITMPKSHTSSYYQVEGEEDMIPLNKLENTLNKANANKEEIAEAFSLREQTMFRNMQLLSLSVQPDDCPERLFGIRESSPPRDNEFSRVIPQTYAPGAMNIAQHHNQPLLNSPASVHTPKHPAKVIRPSAKPVKHSNLMGDRLPNAPRM